MNLREILRRKRDGGAHPPEELRGMIAAYARGEMPDYQMSAWLMAAFLRGLDPAETGALTRALIDSGRTLDWSGLGRPTADKHSTGGVGDKVSLALAPLVAACGVAVPMVSGRGLGHTGGTLDKLESIPGFRTQLAPDQIRRQLERLGVVMVGQGPDLAPADGMLYALRDVTATVECLPFIVSSIVSKKVAEGAGAVVYDVKCGSGAFMKTPAAARTLAERLVEATRALGRAASAAVTDMSQPLGTHVGNALEVKEAVDVLRGGGPPDTRALTMEFAAEMIHLAGAAPGRDAARAAAQRTLDSGAAWERWLQLVEAQGGDPGALEDVALLPAAPLQIPVPAPRAGVVTEIDTQALGELVVEMGGGRRRKEDDVDPRVGLVVLRKRGDGAGAGDPLALLHLAGEDPGGVARCAACFTMGDAAPRPTPLVLERIGGAPDGRRR